MKKILFSTLIIILVSLGACVALADDGLRNYDGVEIPKGTFIPVISTQEISTEYCDVGSKIKFISTSDLYLYETNIIPQQTEFFGYVEKVNEPIIGTNGSMVIRIGKLRLSDGFEIPVKGYIYSSNGNLIGGELTEPAKFDKKASYRQGFAGMYGYAPGATRRMGEHKVITSGADLIIILTGPLFITHTVTN